MIDCRPTREDRRCEQHAEEVASPRVLTEGGGNTMGWTEKSGQPWRTLELVLKDFWSLLWLLRLKEENTVKGG